MDLHTLGFYRLAALIPQSRVGDCAYNAEQIINLMYQSSKKGADFVVFPQLALTTASCGDLFGQRVLLDAAERALCDVVRKTEQLPMIAAVGFPLFLKGAIYNSVAVFGRGKIYGIVPLSDSTCSRCFSDYEYDDTASIILDDFPDVIVPFSPDLLFEQAGSGLTFCIGARRDSAGCSLCINPLAEVSSPVLFDDLKRYYSVWSKKNHTSVLFVNAGWGESSTDGVCAGEAGVFANGEELASVNGFSFHVEGVNNYYTGDSVDAGMLITDIDAQKVSLFRGNATTHKGMRIALPEPAPLTLPPLFAHNPVPFIPRSVQNDPVAFETFFARIIEMQARGLVKRMEHIGCKQLILGVSGGLDSTLALLVAHAAAGLSQLDSGCITAVTMPGFGTTKRTKSNALDLAELLGCAVQTIPIKKALTQHFSDIEHDVEKADTVYENAQARERTQILMDKANQLNALLVGTGDLSEAALGWATYNGDHMSMYNVNAGLPKTLIKYCIKYFMQYPPACINTEENWKKFTGVLQDILDTPISPELLPAEKNKIAQKTEDILGPYELHDFFLYYVLHTDFSPRKVLFLAEQMFSESPYKKYTKKEILRCLKLFYRRFFSQQFKRSCSPDGPSVGCGSFSPRGAWRMPSDACANVWLAELETLKA